MQRQIAWSIVIAAFVLGFFYLLTNRYSIVTNSRGAAYRLNRMTGTVFIVEWNRISEVKKKP